MKSPWGTAKNPQRDHDGSRVQSPQSRDLGVQVPPPKYRKKMLFGKIKRHLGQVIHDLARRKQCRIEEGHLMPDHVHMLISIPPKYSVAKHARAVAGHHAQHQAQRTYNVRRSRLRFAPTCR